jgi:hypothetical protein
MAMKDGDARALSGAAVTVADLYLELASIRVRTARSVLVPYPSAAVFAQGADCLYEAIAHLRDAAERFLDQASPGASELERLADELLAVAAAFEQTGDMVGGRSEH